MANQISLKMMNFESLAGSEKLVRTSFGSRWNDGMRCSEGPLFPPIGAHQNENCLFDVVYDRSCDRI